MTEASKAQPVRLFDVLVLGPWLLWLGARHRTNLHPIERAGLVAAGALTIAYNAKNFLQTERQIGLLKNSF
jgi:hypothetical protein